MYLVYISSDISAAKLPQGMLRTLNAFYVSDINECNFMNGGCDHNCTNEVGTRTCSCNSGFELEDDNMTCAGEELYRM